MNQKLRTTIEEAKELEQLQRDLEEGNVAALTREAQTTEAGDLFEAHDIAGELCDALRDITRSLPYSEHRSAVSCAWGEALDLMLKIGNLARTEPATALSEHSSAG